KNRCSFDARRDRLEQLQPLAGRAVFEIREPSRVAPRVRHAFHETAADRIGDLHEYHRDGARRLQHWACRRTPDGQNDVGVERHQFGGIFADALGITGAPSDVDVRVASLGPAQLGQSLQECGEARLRRRIVGRKIYQYADAPCPFGLLRPRRKRPRGRRAADERDELATLHSITSSAATSSFSGTVSPSIVAVWALITNSNLFDCTTGRSAGLAPLRMRPA